MTQVSSKLLKYLQSENSKTGKVDFSITEIFVSSGIDFGGTEMIARALDELENSKIVEKTGYIGGSYRLLSYFFVPYYILGISSFSPLFFCVYVAIVS